MAPNLIAMSHLVVISCICAQLDIPLANDAWISIADCIRRIGPQVAALRQERKLGAAIIDVGVSFDEQFLAVSFNVPSYAAEAVGRYGIDMEFSVYLTGGDH